ncbi:hypothetical protein [Flavobacterium mekongense]|uniref:hypothetical protein n=1 Tax=Flavobacterium mekongense TaxID=3379707 RepID=UPI00399B44CD
MKKILFITLFLFLTSFSEAEKQDQENKDILTEKILDIVFRTENLSKLEGSHVHVKTEKIDNNNRRVTIVINNFTPKKCSSESKFNEKKVFGYTSNGLNNYSKQLDYSAFFVPDCPLYQFLVYSEKNEILDIKKITLYDYEN